MNILHLRYALEVEKSRSITKAADKLHMNQPHLSKAIKELEEKMGFDIFNRMSKGVVPTKTGSEFLQSAKIVLSQIDEMEYNFKPENRNKIVFNIGVPHGNYISSAFCDVVKNITTSHPIDISCKETNLVNVLNGVCDNEFSIGIVRFPVIDKGHYLHLINHRGLKWDWLWEFAYRVTMSPQHALAKNKNITLAQLSPYIQISQGTLDDSDYLNRKSKTIDPLAPNKFITVQDRDSQYKLLHTLPQTYMFVPPSPPNGLKDANLIEVDCTLKENLYMDVLVCKENYRLTDIDTRFIHYIRNSLSKL